MKTKLVLIVSLVGLTIVFFLLFAALFLIKEGNAFGIVFISVFIDLCLIACNGYGLYLTKRTAASDEPATIPLTDVASYFGLYKQRVSTMLSRLLMLKKNKRAVKS
jgi:hypothetical protein